MELSIVIPTVNSGKIISDTLGKVETYMKKSKEVKDFEIIVAAQSSDDDTFSILEKNDSIFVRALYLEKRGKGLGLNAGMKEAKFNFILMTDDDLPYDLEFIGKAIHYMHEYDIVIGSRYMHNHKHKVGIVRRITSLGYRFLVRILLGLKQSDVQAGIKMMKKDVFYKLGYPADEGYVWDTELLMKANKAGMKVLELPVKLSHTPNQLRLRKAVPRMFASIMKLWCKRICGMI